MYLSKKKEFYHNVTIFNTQIASKIKGLKTDLQFQKFNRSTFSSNWYTVMASSTSFPSINKSKVVLFTFYDTIL